VNQTAGVQSSSAAAVAEVAAGRLAPPTRSARLASVRVSPEGYLATSCALTFISFLCLRSSLDVYALVTIALAWMVTPLCAFTDRVNFDGRALSRQGLIALLHRLVSGRRLELPVSEIERVETSAVRTLRRGGRVRYRYRSEVTGDGLSFSFASGGEGYRRMVRTMFTLVPEEKLDARSRELRDYLSDKRSLRTRLDLLHLASSDVLEGATLDLDHHAKRIVRHQRVAVMDAPSSADVERGRMLRRAANELRAAGRLREAAEAFRRALLVMPRDGWLIYEFARFLRSQASAIGDARLLARSRAGLRLAGSRGPGDATLLSRIGESFIEYSEIELATRAFRRALELDPASFRAEMGLAEVALRNGQLAHVIHHYTTATRIAADRALARLARREADYYSRLNDDDDYLAAELRRINWLQSIFRARRIAARVTLASLLLALLGGSIDEAVADIGWSLASSSLVCWIGVAIMSRFLTPRRKWRTAE
jgi:tetratricopeptide (TPR) repeat protein